jgi:signal transduction histidine kinase
MRERAELVGAEFTVTSRPGHGTEVVVRFRLPEPV